MPEDKTAETEWVQRVLGITIQEQPVANGDPAAAWTKLRQTWQTASDAADAQIADLQSALRGSGDKRLEKIAEFGLNAVTGNFKVPLMAAMQQVETAGASPESLAKLAPMVEGFLKHVQTDQRVQACDENPLNVKLSLRATLGNALAAMQQAIAATHA